MPTPVIVVEQAVSPTASPTALLIKPSPSPIPVTSIEDTTAQLPTPEPTPVPKPSKPDKPESQAGTTFPVEEDETESTACASLSQGGVWLEIANPIQAFTSGDEVVLYICASALLDGQAP